MRNKQITCIFVGCITGATIGFILAFLSIALELAILPNPHGDVIYADYSFEGVGGLQSLLYYTLAGLVCGSISSITKYKLWQKFAYNLAFIVASILLFTCTLQDARFYRSIALVYAFNFVRPLILFPLVSLLSDKLSGYILKKTHLP